MIETALIGCLTARPCRVRSVDPFGVGGRTGQSAQAVQVAHRNRSTADSPVVAVRVAAARTADPQLAGPLAELVRARPRRGRKLDLDGVQSEVAEFLQIFDQKTLRRMREAREAAGGMDYQ